MRRADFEIGSLSDPFCVKAQCLLFPKHHFFFEIDLLNAPKRECGHHGGLIVGNPMQIKGKPMEIQDEDHIRVLEHFFRLAQY